MPLRLKSPLWPTPTSGTTGSKPNRPRRLRLLSRLSGSPQYLVRFGRMTGADVAGVAEIEAECFSQPWSARTLAGELENPCAVFFVARSGSRVVGYAGMHRVLDEGYIANVAVTAEFRRRGVATALMKRMFLYARREKLGFLTLEVREGNRAAVAFYEKLGFGAVGRRRNFYASPAEDAILMTAFLTRGEQEETAT